MTLVVTGATGNLGGLAIDALVRRGVPPISIIAAGRNPGRLAELAAHGIGTAQIDLDDPATLRAAFEGATKVLLISAPGSPRRVTQHLGAIGAAREAGVELIAYTSWTHADTSTMSVAADHHATEEALRNSGIAWVMLRCSGYFESRTSLIPWWRSRGEVVGAAGHGAVSAGSRADLAEAATVVVTKPGHRYKVYELASEKSFTMTEFAAELARQSGDDLAYVDLAAEDFQALLVSSGVAERAAQSLADYDRAVAAGELIVATGDMQRLLGRPVTELPEAISTALAGFRDI